MLSDRTLPNGKSPEPSPIHSAFTTGVQLLSAGRASLLLRHSTEPVLFIAAAVGLDASLLASTRIPVGSGIAGLVVERGVALFGRKDEQTFMSAPVMTEMGVEGALNLTDRTGGRQYTPEDMDGAGAIARHIGHLIQYSRHAAHDLVSGLPNRRAFEEVLEREIALSRRTGSAFAVVFLDIDNLKSINDSHGHAKGDDLIKSVGAALQHILRPYDFAGRYGGDEFALLLSGAGESDGGIVSRIEAALVAMADSIQLPVTASVGVARCPADGTSANQLVATADARMYANKRDGRLAREQTLRARPT